MPIDQTNDKPVQVFHFSLSATLTMDRAAMDQLHERSLETANNTDEIIHAIQAGLSAGIQEGVDRVISKLGGGQS